MIGVAGSVAGVGRRPAQAPWYGPRSSIRWPPLGGRSQPFAALTRTGVQAVYMNVVRAGEPVAPYRGGGIDG